ncbi:hypothetical protein E5288_WYG014165 [Bos mutus]|uniref:Uncharacterized protein n=1 Tax=Bos mutus TaxID=72004 RepID=A0A6B0R4F8_9CETA|nr:hypothetical protein [Bos mutus]
MSLLNLERSLEIPNGLAGATMIGAFIPEGYQPQLLKVLLLQLPPFTSGGNGSYKEMCLWELSAGCLLAYDNWSSVHAMLNEGNKKHLISCFEGMKESFQPGQEVEFLSLKAFISRIAVQLPLFSVSSVLRVLKNSCLAQLLLVLQSGDRSPS